MPPLVPLGWAEPRAASENLPGTQDWPRMKGAGSIIGRPMQCASGRIETKGAVSDPDDRRGN